jgi:N-acetylneuraminic acid mutarotase
MPRATADGVTGVIGGRLYVLIGAAKISESETVCNVYACPIGAFRTLYRYDPASNTWVTMRIAPHFHRNGAGGVINGKFYVAGGYDDYGKATTYLDAYDPATNSWKTLAPLPTAMTGLKGAVLQNRLFIIGTQATYAYTPGTNTWVKKAVPPPNTAAQAGGASAVTIALNGLQRILVVGGDVTSAGPHPTSLYTP